MTYLWMAVDVLFVICFLLIRAYVSLASAVKLLLDCEKTRQRKIIEENADKCGITPETLAAVLKWPKK